MIHDQNKLAPVSPSFKDVTIDDIPRKLNIISSTVMDQKIIHTLPGEDFSIGSIVYWSKSHWLITERDPEDEITVRGRIQICRKEIKWQDDNSHEIHSLWATVEKPYYSNLEENKQMSYSTREFRMSFWATSTILKILKLPCLVRMGQERAAVCSNMSLFQTPKRIPRHFCVLRWCRKKLMATRLQT